MHSFAIGYIDSMRLNCLNSRKFIVNYSREAQSRFSVVIEWLCYRLPSRHDEFLHHFNQFGRKADIQAIYHILFDYWTIDGHFLPFYKRFMRNAQNRTHPIMFHMKFFAVRESPRRNANFFYLKKKRRHCHMLMHACSRRLYGF